MAPRKGVLKRSPDCPPEMVFVESGATTSLRTAPPTRTSISSDSWSEVARLQRVRIRECHDLRQVRQPAYRLVHVRSALRLSISRNDLAQVGLAGLSDHWLDRCRRSVETGRVGKGIAGRVSAERLSANETTARLLMEAARTPNNWALATLGRLPPALVKPVTNGSDLEAKLAPMLLLSEGAHWLSSEDRVLDIAFLSKQNFF